MRSRRHRYRVSDNELLLDSIKDAYTNRPGNLAVWFAVCLMTQAGREFGLE